MREMAKKMESPEGLEVYRMRAKTVERLFGHVKQNIGLREFLTRDLQGVRAEFSLACIAHNLKRIWKIKSQIEDIGVSPTEDGRFDQTFFKSLCGRIKGVWSNFLCSLSFHTAYKCIYQQQAKVKLIGDTLHLIYIKVPRKWREGMRKAFERINKRAITTPEGRRIHLEL